MKNIDELAFQKKINQLKVSVLPDFYLDVILDPKRSFSELDTQFQEVYTRGGGNIIGTEVKFIPGGNGGNVAKTLAALGSRTTFLTKTSRLGIKLLKEFLGPLGVKIIANSDGILASSVILELKSMDDNKANIMLSSAGSVATFSSKMLSEDQWRVLKSSQSIAITNAQNLELEDLVEQILENIPSEIFVSIDFSDLTPHKSRINGFRSIILSHPKKTPNLIVGNETEFCLLAKCEKDSFMDAGYSLSSDFPNTYFALHTIQHSYLWKGGELITSQSCYNIKPLHVTGAGDAWHAGFLVGWQCGLPDKQILEFANAVAGYQVVNEGKIGSLSQIIRFMNVTPKRMT